MLGPSRAPRNFLVHEITATSISVTWNPPDEGDINGVLSRYQVTYYGRLLDTQLHIENIKEDLENLQNVDLDNLQEDTLYTISVVLFSSGIRGPPATIDVRTLQAGKYTFHLFPIVLHTCNYCYV